MVMSEGETLKTYSDRYWETYNEIDGNFKDVAMRTFKVGLSTEHELRKSLTMKSTSNMCQLMDRIEEYKRVEKDQMQGKGKAKMFPEKRDSLEEEDTRVVTPEGSFPIKSHIRELSWSTHCLKSQCIKYWRKLKMNLILSGPIRWPGTRPGETKAFIAITIRTEDILQKIVEPCKIT